MQDRFEALSHSCNVDKNVSYQGEQHSHCGIIHGGYAILEVRQPSFCFQLLYHCAIWKALLQ